MHLAKQKRIVTMTNKILFASVAFVTQNNIKFSYNNRAFNCISPPICEKGNKLKI